MTARVSARALVARAAPACVAAVVAAGIALGMAVTPASAQSSREWRAFMQKIERMEQDLQDLQRSAYRGDGKAAASGVDGSAVATMQGRIADLERTVAQLTGRIEEMQYENRLLTQQVEHLLMADSGALDGDRPAPMSGSEISRAGSARRDAQYSGRSPGGYASGDGRAATPGPQGTPPRSGFPRSDDRGNRDGSPQVLGSYPVESSGSPTGGLSEEAGQRRQGSSQVQESAFQGTEQQVFQQAFRSLAGGRYDDAEQGFDAFLARFPDSPKAGEATYWLGEAHFARERFSDASRAFYQSAKEHPDSPKAPSSLLKLAMSLRALDKKDESCAVLDRLRDQYPDTDQRIQQNAARLRNQADCR